MIFLIGFTPCKATQTLQEYSYTEKKKNVPVPQNGQTHSCNSSATKLLVTSSLKIKKKKTQFKKNVNAVNGSHTVKNCVTNIETHKTETLVSCFYISVITEPGYSNTVCCCKNCLSVF